MSEEAPPSCMQRHVAWLEFKMLNTAEEASKVDVEPWKREEARQMLDAIEKEYKFQRDRLACEDLALRDRKALACMAHKQLKCLPICSFWHIMKKGRRPESYKVNFFCTHTDDCLWPGFIYNENH